MPPEGDICFEPATARKCQIFCFLVVGSRIRVLAFIDLTQAIDPLCMATDIGHKDLLRFARGCQGQGALISDIMT